MGHFAGMTQETLCEFVNCIPRSHFCTKLDCKEAGQKLTEVAEKLNCYSLFRDIPQDQRSVREQFNKLLKDHKNKKNKDEQASGIIPDPPTVK